MYLANQQARVYMFVKSNPGSTMEEIRRGARASKADMRCSEINYMSRKEKGEDLIITTERDEHKWCHKALNRQLKHTVKKEGDKLEIIFK